ncbi:hypothetical protein HOS16_gp57 [Shigella phage vB_SflS-ISF001]|uniref:Uncharacterized protein n=1 Tax=Shigella phage vB_SflS-ISF001 TaxID=2048005 RepID=A0A2D1GQ95_9CAUD|nr:hypothetical protein HOS16_gp57 [Shigella phage vB_SflS-ISF001]ATN94135.1 hypothetical protein FLXISF001_057 [Shigella phage vB_SflS-ISF001]
MLKREEVIFPIKFISMGCGVITFTSDDKGTCATDEVSQLMLESFIARHNGVNKENSPDKDYYYNMSVNQNTYSLYDSWKIEGSIFKAGKLEIKPSLQCTQIENVPLSATQKGVQINSHSWIETTATPKTIEVHDHIIRILLLHGGFKNKTVSGVISTTRGTLVPYQVK